MFKVKYAFIECLLSLSLFMVPFHVVAADDQAVQALTLALEECDLAQEDRVSRQPIQAQVHIQRFSEQRDNALSIDASVADDEEVAERIRRCDRLSAIVKRSNQAFEQQQAAIDNVVEESNLYIRECELGLQILQSGAVSERSVRSAAKAVGRAEEHKASLQDEWRAFAVFRKNPEHKSRVAMAANLAEGNACMESANLLLNTKRKALQKIDQELKPLIATARASRQICDRALRAATRSPTEANLQTTRALLLRAQSQEKELLGQMRANRTVKTEIGSSPVKKLNSESASVTACVIKAEASVAEMAEVVRKKIRQLETEKAERLAKEARKAERHAEERAKAGPSEVQMAEAGKGTSLHEEMLRVEAEAEEKARADARQLAKERAEKARASPWRR